MLNTRSIPKGATLTVVFSLIFGTVRRFLFKNSQISQKSPAGVRSMRSLRRVKATVSFTGEEIALFVIFQRLKLP
jgi:hypothetical protein